jgi:uncharacterized membrane protein YsdA (DUF1294 family)
VEAFFVELLYMFIIASYLLMSSLAFLLYAKDKQAAIKHHRRISEQTLWMVGLLCGWPGALIAQKLLRHKTSKPYFLIVFRLTVLVNMGLLLGFYWLYFREP